MQFAEACKTLSITASDLSERKIIRSYKTKCLQVHPDRGGKSSDFVKVRDARNCLLNYLRSHSDDIGVIGQVMSSLFKSIVKTNIVYRKLIATVDQALNADLFPFKFNHRLYLVPVWERQNVYYMKGSILIVDVKIETLQNLFIDSKNDVFLSLEISLNELIKLEQLECVIGSTSHIVPLERIAFQERQTILLSTNGLPMIGHSWLEHDLLKRASIFLHLHII
jgi:hypothetical protein